MENGSSTNIYIYMNRVKFHNHKKNVSLILSVPSNFGLLLWLWILHTTYWTYFWRLSHCESDKQTWPDDCLIDTPIYKWYSHQTSIYKHRWCFAYFRTKYIHLPDDFRIFYYFSPIGTAIFAQFFVPGFLIPAIFGDTATQGTCNFLEATTSPASTRAAGI